MVTSGDRAYGKHLPWQVFYLYTQFGCLWLIFDRPLP